MNLEWSDLIPWLLAATGLVVLCGFFSGTEVAMFGLRRVEREQLGRSGRTIDALVLRLLGQPRRLVTSVLIGSEIVTMTLAIIAVVVLQQLWTDASALALIAAAVGLVTPLVLLLGIIVPRTLAIREPIAWARAAARPLAWFALLATPVRWLVQGASDWLARRVGAGGRSRAAGDLSAAEFRTLVDAGNADGQVDARERRLIHKVFEFGDKNVGQIMTPRDQVFALSYDLPMSRLSKEIAARGFSRVPIYLACRSSLDVSRDSRPRKTSTASSARMPWRSCCWTVPRSR